MKSLTKIAAAVALAGAFAAPAFAQSATYSFVVGSDYVDVTLADTTAAYGSFGAADTLYGVTFSIAGLDLTGSAVSIRGTPSVVNCSSGTCVAASGLDVAAPWGWATVGGLSNYLTALNGGVGQNGPDQGILNSTVTTVGASLQNDAHNPLYQGPVTFRISNTAIDLGMTVSNVGLHFGTTLSPAVPAIPEPETYALMLAGLAAVGFMARRRRQA